MLLLLLFYSIDPSPNAGIEIVRNAVNERLLGACYDGNSNDFNSLV